MKLTQEGIDLITKVRDRMYESECRGAESFICWNLAFEASGIRKVDEHSLLDDERSLQDWMDDIGGVCREIWQAIGSALNEEVLMETYIYRELEKIGTRITSKKSYEFAKLARLAWLDRIIETGEIK